MLSRHHKQEKTESHQQHFSKGFATRYVEANVQCPKYEMPRQSMSAQGAYQAVKDKIVLDGNPILNLASFVNTWCEPEADQLYLECSNKNLADQFQYPNSNEIQDLCVNILANLYNAPEPSSRTDSGRAEKKNGEEMNQNEEGCIGSSCIGSSEAILLGGLAMKWRWREKVAKKRGCTSSEVLDRCNMILSSASHVSLLKFCLYFDVECRVVNITHDRFILDPKKVVELCDENTIGVMAIMGNTLTGEFDDIQGLSEALDELEKSKGFDIPIHVDAASGGFVAPFIAPDLKWDFRVPRVRSINTSGHKFGLVYPGLGWILFRSKSDLPSNLVFHVNYLGSDEPTFTLNFSKPASQVVLQYYNFIRLGWNGYHRIIQQCVQNARYIAHRLKSSGLFSIISKNDHAALPVVVFRFSVDAKELGFDEKRLVKQVQRHGWILPAYNLSKAAEDWCVIRCVVRESLTLDMVENLLDAIGEEWETLMNDFSSETTQKTHLPKCRGLRKKPPGNVMPTKEEAKAEGKKGKHHPHQHGLTHIIC